MNFKAENFHQGLYQHICRYEAQALKWYQKKSDGIPHPFYSGFDIRDSAHKIAPVDANVFPAGFNNLSAEDQNQTSALMSQYLKKYAPSLKKILLLTEEHTNNLYYWENILTLKTLMEKGGYEVAPCVARELVSGERTVSTATGQKISLQLLQDVQGDLIISNNDFSSDCDLPQDRPCLPPLKMGWKTRRKHDFFIHYNKLAGEFSEIIDMNPWHFQIKTELFSPFDVTSKENLKTLKSQVTDFLKELQTPAPSSEKPYLFLKNNYGTYGLGITTVSDPEEVLSWNYKTRKDLKATKGGGGVRELILQEGIPSSLFKKEPFSAEPVIYMVGSRPAGGFLRIHEKKDCTENLNRPGVTYKPLSSDRLTNDYKIMKAIYEWIGRIGFLAVGEELKQSG
ncbi:MAG: glutamate--cysteine ligase [Bdellovibrionales bacterium]|nr:glutamate--cysteine ligase [Bdellovibrionales bacterium]